MSTTTHLPEARVHRPRISSRLVAVIALVAIVAAGIAGYAIAGGFTSEHTPGQQTADQVMNVWKSGDPASVAATYDQAAKVVLVYDNADHVVASSRKDVTEAARGAVDYGNRYRQIGPVASYVAEDGDVYVASLVEVTGPGHPNGVPLVGFYRVRNGKVIRHVFLDAEHY